MIDDRFGLGCWAFGLAEKDSEDERRARSVLRSAYEHGVRHFDTAQSYGDGRSEDIIGSALEDFPDVEVATKSSLLPGGETMDAVEASLRRLRRDTIGIFYIHWPRKGIDPRPMLEILGKARDTGKIRRIGVSNFSVEELRLGSDVAEIDVHQIGYSLLWRYPEGELRDYCREHRIEIYSYSSLAQGLLTGKIPKQPRFEPGDPRPDTVFYDEEVWPHVYDAVDEMNRIAGESGFSLHHLAIRWLTDIGGVDRVLVGAKTMEQLSDNLSAFAATPDRKTLLRLEEVSDRVTVHIPDIGNIFKFYP